MAGFLVLRGNSDLWLANRTNNCFGAYLWEHRRTKSIVANTKQKLHPMALGAWLRIVDRHSNEQHLGILWAISIVAKGLRSMSARKNLTSNSSRCPAGSWDVGFAAAP